MLIQKIRDNSQSVFLKVIIGVIVLSFVGFGVDAVFNSPAGSRVVASVNGNEITEQELVRATENLKRTTLARMGDNVDPFALDDAKLREQAINILIQRQLLSAEAEKSGFRIADNRVNQIILNTTEFQVDNRFDADRYQAILRNVGLTPRMYKESVTEDLILNQIQAGIGQSNFVTTAEVDNTIELDRQTRDMALMTISAAEMAKNGSVTDEQVQAYFDANAADFQTDESVVVSFVELKREDFFAAVEVSEEEIKAQYEQEVATLKNNEERRAAHILIAFSDQQDKAAAQAKLAEVQLKLAGGEAFAELAKTYSDDTDSGESGGDLGFATQGDYVPAFEEALYALEKGQVSEAVETEFGLHLIKLLDVKAIDLPSLASLREKLVKDIRFTKSEPKFVEASEMLANESYGAQDLEGPAELLGLTIQTSKAIERSGTGEGLEANPRVINAAFSADLIEDGNNSELIELTRDHVVVVRTKEHNPAQTRPLAEVREGIVSKLRQSAAESAAKQQGGKVIAALNAGKDTEEVAKEFGYQWAIHDKVARRQAELDQQLVEAAFKLPKPVENKTLSGVTLANGDYVVIALTNIHEPNTDIVSPQEKQMLGNFMANQMGQLDQIEFRQNLTDQGDVERSLN